MSDYFFCVTALDRAKTWSPVTTAIMDVPTAFAFFGASPAATVRKLEALVSGLSESWNADQVKKSTVSKKIIISESNSINKIFLNNFLQN